MTNTRLLSGLPAAGTQTRSSWETWESFIHERSLCTFVWYSFMQLWCRFHNFIRISEIHFSEAKP
jgi:hypothetical protein